MQTKIKTQKEIAELPVGFVCQCVNSHDELINRIKTSTILLNAVLSSKECSHLKSILQRATKFNRQAIVNAEKEA